MASEPNIQQERTIARRAHALRQQGQFTQALQEYDELIAHGHARENSEVIAAGHLGRGEVKLAQNFYSGHEPALPVNPQHPPPLDEGMATGAIEELTAAVLANPASGRAHAQLAESHRMYARDFMRIMPKRRFRQHLEAAREGLARTRELLPERAAWISAHEGAVSMHEATRALCLEIGGKGKFVEASARFSSSVEALLADAEAKFREALTLDPNYGWARHFLAYLLSLKGEHQDAMVKLGETVMGAGQVAAGTSTALSMMNRYAAGQMLEQSSGTGRRAKANAEERERLLQEAIFASRRAMQENAEDFMAIYAHAASCMDAGTPAAASLAREASGRIVNLGVRALLMAFALHKSAGHDENDFFEFVDSAVGAAHLDLEIAAIAFHDPMWRHSPKHLAGRLGKLVQSDAPSKSKPKSKRPGERKPR